VRAAFHELQMEWYGALAQEGFEDIEDVTHPERPLIKWSGVSHDDYVYSERADLPAWPKSPFVMQEELLYHPELTLVCESICKHGNHSLKPLQVKLILEMTINGMTCRGVGEVLDISYVTVFRAQKKLNEWALLIESREE
jgi:hypothetical protein